MNLDHQKIIEVDLQKTSRLLQKTIISVKLAYYFFQRPIASFTLRRILKKQLNGDQVFASIDKFLLNDGGMFKQYVYETCNGFSPIRNSAVLVPGVGYGRNLFQLAAFKPSIIVTFDPYGYLKQWDFLSKKILKRFGVKVIFLKGDFDVLPKDRLASFDFVITDAVLEHVSDLWKFVENSKKFLKNDGIFYASFGPIWHGPSGDHIFWGKERVFDHLILPEKKYQENFEKRFTQIKTDSTEGAFIVKNKLLSYLSAKEYFETLERSGFRQLLFCAKISTQALSLLRKTPKIHKLLNQENIPKFDRFCSGFYLWMKR